MTRCRFLSVILLSLIFFSLHAQKHPISGVVLDSETYSPLINANISLTGSRTGCTSGLDGAFTIQVDTLPVYMIISYLGYETQHIWIDSKAEGLNVLMKPTASLLKEIEISSGKPEVFFKDDKYSILDYTIDHSFIYMIIFRYRTARAELICKKDNGEIIARSCTLPFKPTRLFADCLGYIHLLSPDSSYQVFLNKDTLLFPHRATLSKFYGTLSDCITSTADWLYFRKESNDKLSVSFYRINRHSGLRSEINTYRDEDAFRMLRDHPYDYYLLTMDTLPASFNEMIAYSWVKKIQYKSNLSVMEKTGDSLVIINTTDGSVDILNISGYLVNHLQMPLSQHTGEKWMKNILNDPVSHCLYTTFLKNGRLHLYKLDLSKGHLQKTLTLAHSFPQHVMVHNNYLYYLYDVPGLMDNKQLLRESIR
ncbi:MAG TPA: carboxypeptidase-like regulatory domain-containing protein [Bacteroidales bacterium]|nr:carboxypeptidase-like regulatory domain-containing protein [Bacteroidales bacterium]